MLLGLIAYGFVTANLVVDWLSGGGWYSAWFASAPLLSTLVYFALRSRWCS